MESIVRFSLRQKIFFNLVFVLLFVAGFFAINELPTQRYPNVNFGEVVITTMYPGASPSDVETLVTRKLEDSLESIENIEWLKATSFPERSLIHLKFIDDTDYKYLYNEVRLKILNTISELPVEVDPPVIVKPRIWLFASSVPAHLITLPLPVSEFASMSPSIIVVATMLGALGSMLDRTIFRPPI